jgi:hypothetical protein
MLAPNPSQHLESEINRLGNLEGSVRSRGTNRVDSTKRDLIEAGLNEPAGGGRGYGDYVCGARSKARHWRRRVTIFGD